MSKTRRHLCIFAALSILVCGVACAEAPKAKVAEGSASAGVAATVGGESIMTHEVDEAFLAENMKLAQQLYDARRQALEGIIQKKLLAQEASSRGVTVEELQAEVASKSATVDDSEIAAFFNENQSRMGGRTLEQMTPQIRNYLSAQKQASVQKDYFEDLKKKAGVTVNLNPPRANIVVAANDMYMGNPGAKVTIVEYSDFQ
jgi:hypothetical protein